MKIAVLCMPTWHDLAHCLSINFRAKDGSVSPTNALTKGPWYSWQCSACLGSTFPIFALMFCMCLGRCFFSQLSGKHHTHQWYFQIPSQTTNLPSTRCFFCPPKHRQGFPALKGPCGLKPNCSCQLLVISMPWWMGLKHLRNSRKIWNT